MMISRGSRSSSDAIDRPSAVAKATESRRSVASSADPRCERTRTAILEAYVALCGERGDENAGIAEICRRARVNRATFYRHYEDRADLLDRGLEGLFARIGEEIDPLSVEEGRTSRSAIQRIEVLFELIEEYAGLLRPILSGSAGALLRAKVESFVEGYIESRRVARLSLPGDRFALPREAIPRALASLCIGFASWWLDHPKSLSPREAAGCYLTFISTGLFAGRRGGAG
jgi:AcrR family transcriptional regulator